MRIGTALVRGPSMVPSLYDGDCVLLDRTGPVRAGDVVVARYRARPDLLVVKRAVRQVGGGWELSSDNPYATGPSGVADVEARVLLRYWPLSRAGRVPARP